jgi:hypothetical protein
MYDGMGVLKLKTTPPPLPHHDKMVEKKDDYHNPRNKLADPGDRETGFCRLIMMGKFPESAVQPFTLFVICDICDMRVRHVTVTKLIIGITSRTTGNRIRLRDLKEALRWELQKRFRKHFFKSKMPHPFWDYPPKPFIVSSRRELYRESD